MTGRRAILGLCALCALLISAFAAQAASAQTAYECTAVSSGATFSDAHCTTAGTGAGFKHVEITPGVSKAITLSNAKTGPGTTSAEPTLLSSTVSGVEVEIQATGVSGTGTMENKVSGSEMFAEGSGTITYSGATVLKPAGKGCVVKNGGATTKALTASTKGLTNALKFAPTSGSTFVVFEIEGCSIAALNGVYEVTGNVTSSSITGTTTNFEAKQTKEQGTLKLRGQTASINGKVTISDANGGLALT
jgi:hypothetical protein